MTNKDKLQEVRNIMVSQGFDGFIVPRTDEYLGEYVPACAERLAWLTSFTGSAGVAVILKDKAVVMSDSRYSIQLADQVDLSCYAVSNSQDMPLAEWLADNTTPEMVIGYDAKLHTPYDVAVMEEAGVTLKAVQKNLVDIIWADRPQPPLSEACLFPVEYAGLSVDKKIKNIQAMLQDKGADAVLLTMSDSIAWLLNIRGNDIPFIPVILSYAIVPKEGKVQWFVSSKKITKIVKDNLSDYVSFHEEEKISEFLSGLTNKKIWLDEKRSSVFFKSILQENEAEILNEEDPCLVPRACKTLAEQSAMKNAHIRDGVALVQFLKWFDEQAPMGGLTELSVEKKLEEFRAQAPEFKEPSFTTIAGYGPHGAIVHYRATEETNSNINVDNILLLDSGAQYSDGTTDITRTILIGNVPDAVKEHNTLVLQGHIALASAVFSKGTTGKEIDKLARAPLQAKGLNYGHGTGHGVGCYLSVHEESAGISPRGERAIEAGMILSNEPGYYAEGAYGIRIENLVLAKELDDNQLCFETITFAPIDKGLIQKEMMSAQEVAWLNQYHEQVFEKISPFLDKAHQEWLKQVTSPL